jgi:hypothetical protein
MPSPVGRGMLDPAVELRYDAETAKRVMYWLQYCLPWVAEQAGASAEAISLYHLVSSCLGCVGITFMSNPL